MSIKQSFNRPINRSPNQSTIQRYIIEKVNQSITAPSHQADSSTDDAFRQVMPKQTVAGSNLQGKRKNACFQIGFTWTRSNMRSIFRSKIR